MWAAQPASTEGLAHSYSFDPEHFVKLPGGVVGVVQGDRCWDVWLVWARALCVVLGFDMLQLHVHLHSSARVSTNPRGEVQRAHACHPSGLVCAPPGCSGLPWKQSSTLYLRMTAPPALPAVQQGHIRDEFGSRRNDLVLGADAPAWVYSTAPLAGADGKPVAPPQPGSAGTAMRLSDQQVNPCFWVGEGEEGEL